MPGGSRSPGSRLYRSRGLGLIRLCPISGRAAMCCKLLGHLCFQLQRTAACLFRGWQESKASRAFKTRNIQRVSRERERVDEEIGIRPGLGLSLSEERKTEK
eukprot:g27450.t1